MSLRDEIDQQPEILAGILAADAGPIEDAAALLAAPETAHVLIAARGTSDNAARYAKYVWGSLGGLPVTLAAPSLYGGYGTPPQLNGAVVVGISQSGQSPDLVEVVVEGSRQSRPTIAITNDPASPLATAADVVVPLLAGPELSVAATKTYTATLLTVARIAASLRSDAATTGDLASVPEAVSAVLDTADEIFAAATVFGPIRDCVVLGRGFNYATSFEWALKLQEMAYILAHPFSTADFAHGPFAVLEPDFPVLAVDVQGAMHVGTRDLLDRVTSERSANLLAVTDEAGRPGNRILVPPTPEWLSPLPVIVAAQLFTMQMARIRGIDPERPRGLRKVTHTR